MRVGRSGRGLLLSSSSKNMEVILIRNELEKKDCGKNKDFVRQIS